MEQKVHGQEEAIAQLYRFTGDHERKFCIVEKELNTTYKAVLEAQAEMAVLHDGRVEQGACSVYSILHKATLDLT